MQQKMSKFAALLFAVAALAVYSWAALPADSVNVAPGQPMVVDDDDETPDVTNRVARISFVDGDARIRRNGSDEWETVTQNLPFVEGDEISTESGARIELQFDKNRHLRLAGNSYLKITTLKDDGIAVSLSMGSLSLRVTSFDKSRSFFEIDAPKTTLAVQKAGRYRVDAGEKGDVEIRASVSEGGEARIYSDTAGFTLRNGRSTRIYIDGANAGEWDTGDVARYDDEFSDWAAKREDVVERRLKDAYFDKYYDDDIYGADDLNDNGDWINTTDYGWVWRPSRLATAQFSNWTPYRYGHWRWMPPYGWIWVNDEPWGWATFHHGRWFSYNGGWVWSPYGYYRARRSWWRPALVVINIYNNNVCWYPLPYRRHYNNYNWNHQPSPRAPKVSTRTPKTIEFGGGPIRMPPNGRVTGKDPDDVPPTGIVTTETSEFGKRSMRVKTAPDAIVKTVFTKADDQPVLPDFKDRRKALDVATERPKLDPGLQTRIGAETRKSDRPMDEDLRTTRMFGGRPPQKVTDDVQPGRDPQIRAVEPRKTGAIDRSPGRDPDEPVKVAPTSETPKPRRIESPRENPVYSPPQPTEKPRYTPPVRETPRNDPPKQTERQSPPTRQPDRSSPPPKSDPKPVDKPDPPSRKEKPDSR